MKNRLLFNKAKKYLVGGVNSPVRSFNYAGVEPLLFAKGKGSKLFDYEGKAYLDYVFCFGAVILGHSHPAVISAAKKAISNGLGFGATCASEVELAALIQKAIPFIEKIRFVNSGTEAVMGAIRLSRGYTGRNKIVKFANAYHGHADYLLAKAGSGLADANISLSKGVPSAFLKHTLIGEYGDIALLERIFKKHGSDIAAVIVEPVGGNYGVLPPEEKFLKQIRKITRKYSSLLIFDEVITGFRFAFGSFASISGIRPDLICLGKIIGGGLPIGAYGGSGKIMNNLSPLGEVYQASTFAGNPVVMQVAKATLLKLAGLKKRYALLKKYTRSLSQTFKKEAVRNNIGLKIDYYGTMFSLRFNKKDKFHQFYRMALEGGVYFAPSEYEANFLSFAHSEDDIRKTQALIQKILRVIK